MADAKSFPHVPLVGQPLEVLGWTLLVNVECKCAGGAVIMLAVTQNELGRHGNLSICPSCGRAMHVAQLTMNAQNQLEFGIELGDSSAAPLGAKH